MKELSKYACDFNKAQRKNNIKEDFRNPFYRDVDKILYSLSYLRYSDKTQVFTFESNDHVIKRSVHVQYVSKIARTIGRELNLNEDLIEASALAHDVGHAPFGHIGEHVLNEISKENGCGYFNHNVHSVRLLSSIENYGKGLNLTYQVLDSVLCHNGEVLSNILRPKEKTLEQFFEEYNSCYLSNKVKLIPCTLEGCVVRISDIVAYIGKDLEDAIRLKKIKLEDVPVKVVEVLGGSNAQIINTLINDIISCSKNKPYIKLSDKVYEALNILKVFNEKEIYYQSYTSVHKNDINKNFRLLFNKYKDDILNCNMDSNINNSYLKNMGSSYRKEDVNKIVIDYIAGMTDNYFISELKKVNKQ